MTNSLISISKVSPVTKNLFPGSDWEIDQVNSNNTSNTVTAGSDYVKLVCAPKNESEHGLNNGAILMSLPTTDDSTLRRVRLRNTLYHKVEIENLSHLEYGTYIISNIDHSAPVLALQIDIDNDNASDFNIFFDPRVQNQLDNSFSVVTNNEWQIWNTLEGFWQFFNVTRSELPVSHFTIDSFVNAFPGARIINTTSGSNAGGGIRFTVGGSDPTFNDFKGYIDPIVIGVKQDKKPTLFDFMCNQANNSSQPAHHHQPGHSPVS